MIINNARLSTVAEGRCRVPPAAARSAENFPERAPRAVTNVAGSVRVAAAAKWRLRRQFAHCRLDSRAFGFEKARHGPPQTRVCDPMRAPRRLRQITPLHLVLTLRAGLDALQAALDGELDGAVVAGLEVEER